MATNKKEKDPIRALREIQIHGAVNRPEELKEVLGALRELKLLKEKCVKYFSELPNIVLYLSEKHQCTESLDSNFDDWLQTALDIEKIIGTLKGCK